MEKGRRLERAAQYPGFLSKDNTPNTDNKRKEMPNLSFVTHSENYGKI